MTIEREETLRHLFLYQMTLLQDLKQRLINKYQTRPLDTSFRTAMTTVFRHYANLLEYQNQGLKDQQNGNVIQGHFGGHTLYYLGDQLHHAMLDLLEGHLDNALTFDKQNVDYIQRFRQMTSKDAFGQ